MIRIFNYTVDDKFNNKPIKSVLKEHYKMSSNLITNLKKEYDSILVNNEHQRVTYILKKGDTLQIKMYDSVSENIVSTHMDINIVYEDLDIIIINKPPFVPSHPSMGNYENTIANALMYYWRSKGEEYVFRAVNRLDKNTSGLMIIAKNAYSHARLCDQLYAKTLKREYTAIVCGTIDKDGIVNAPIAREDDSVIKRCVRSDGQEAITHYKVIKKLKGYTIITLQLKTGRTHQIRVHMSYIGHPLLGDFLYGVEDHSLIKRHALHSSYAHFIHPVTGNEMEFYSEIPKDVNNFIEKFI